VGYIGWEDPVPFLLKTTDGGATWEELPEPMDSGRLIYTWYDDENTGWAVGNSGDLGIHALTTDGGATWEVTSLSGSQVGIIASVRVSLKYNIAVGNLCKAEICSGLLWCSGDSGKTFREMARMERILTGVGDGSIIISANSMEEGGHPSFLAISDEELERLSGMETCPAMVLETP